jgi:ribonuclease HII
LFFRRVVVIVCGVDEAGRGSMVGPLVVAGVAVKQSNVRRLGRLGVRDSKKLTKAAREAMYQEILDIAEDHAIFKISPKTVDAHVFKHNLNHLEASYMAKIIKKLSPQLSYVDSCDVDAARFGRELERLCNMKNIRAHHHADSRFLVVSAASIIAKVTRDRAIDRLDSTRMLGSGYPSDSKTVSFVKMWFDKNGQVPSFVRKSWAPVQKITNYPVA